MPRTHPPIRRSSGARRPNRPAPAARRGSELARGFEPSARVIRTWAQQAERDDGRLTAGLTGRRA